MVKLINILLLIALSISSYAQVNVIEVDSSNQVIIYNNGTLIENNHGTVNIENKQSNSYGSESNSSDHSELIYVLTHFAQLEHEAEERERERLRKEKLSTNGAMKALGVIFGGLVTFFIIVWIDIELFNSNINTNKIWGVLIILGLIGLWIYIIKCCI